MEMACACTCVPEMAIPHIHVAAPLGVAACHKQQVAEDDLGLLANFSYFHMVRLGLIRHVVSSSRK